MTDRDKQCGNSKDECEPGVGFRQEYGDDEQDDRHDFDTRIKFMKDTVSGKILTESDIGEHNDERFLSGSDIYTYNNIVYHTFSKYPRLFFKYLSVLEVFLRLLLAICKKAKAHGVCRPGRDSAVRGQKDLIGLVRSCCLCALMRGLRNLGASLKRF